MRARTLIPILLAVIGLSGAAFIYFQAPAPIPIEATPVVVSDSDSREVSPQRKKVSQSALLATVAAPISPDFSTEALSIPSETIVYTIPVLSETTVLTAMEAYAAANPDFSFSGNDFPGLGFFVEEINGKKNADGNYWILYVNGKTSQKGVSQATVSSGNTVEWKYEKGY